MPATGGSITTPTELKKSDVLLLTTPSPDLLYKSPPKEEVLESLADHARKFYLKHQYYPIIVTEPVGTAQELIAYLCAQGFKVSMSRQIYNFSKIYQENHVDLGSHWSDYKRRYFKEKILILSPQSLGKLKLTAKVGRNIRRGLG